MKKNEKEKKKLYGMMRPNVVAMGSHHGRDALELGRDIAIGNVCSRCQLDRAIGKSPVTLQSRYMRYCDYIFSF